MDFDEHTPLFVISVAAELADMHPQTLRQYSPAIRPTGACAARAHQWQISSLYDAQCSSAKRSCKVVSRRCLA
jgi:MerR family transcriptional regulator/heat shock protein HspR